MLHFIAVTRKQNSPRRTEKVEPLELLGAWVKPETKQAFELVAQAEDRSVSYVLRQMAERRVEEFEAELAEAA